MKALKKNAALLLLVFAAGAGLLASQVKNETEVSDITLANIEALAREEMTEPGVVCSFQCNDGIGQCWREQSGTCVRSGDPHDHCVCFY